MPKQILVETSVWVTIPDDAVIRENSIRLPDGSYLSAVVGFMDMNTDEMDCSEKNIEERWNVVIDEYKDASIIEIFIGKTCQEVGHILWIELT